MNIEGAEAEVIQDLLDSGMYKKLSLICFIKGKGYYPQDLDKISISKEKLKEVETALNIFKEAGINIEAVTGTFSEGLVKTIAARL